MRRYSEYLSLLPQSKIVRIGLTLVLLLMISWSCNKTVELVPENAIQFYAQFEFDDIRRVIPISDGGFIYVGSKDHNTYVLALNQDLTLKFELEHPDYYYPGCFLDIIEASDGTFWAVGYSQSDYVDGGIGNANEIIFQFSSEGQYLLDAIYGDPNPPYPHEQLTTVFEDQSGEIVIGGHANDRAHYGKIGPTGTQFWNLYKVAMPMDILQLDDGRFFMVGNYSRGLVNSFGIYRSIHLESNVYLDTNFSVIDRDHWRDDWYKEEIVNRPIRMDVLPSGDKVNGIIGTFVNDANSQGIMLMKVPYLSEGQVWEKTYYGPGSCLFESMIEISGGYLILGATSVQKNARFIDDHYQAYVLAVDKDGEKLWETYVGSVQKRQSAMAALETADGFTITGYSKDEQSKTTIISFKLDKEGKLIQQ